MRDSNADIDAVFEKSSVASVFGLVLGSGILGATLLRGRLIRLGTPPVRRDEVAGAIRRW